MYSVLGRFQNKKDRTVGERCAFMFEPMKRTYDEA
jgi:hypothetical protein